MKKRILIVEDEVIIADNLYKILTDLGYEVLEPALSYSEAIQSLKNESIDMAILDIQLGGKKTGIDIAIFIRNNTPSLPFIYLTSYSDTKTLESAKKTMPFGYLVKPFEAPNVLTTLEIAFNNHEKLPASNQSALSNEILQSFTNTEKIILEKIARGFNTEEIAKQLVISKSTVKNHRHNICKKIGLSGASNSLTNWVLRNEKTLLNF